MKSLFIYLSRLAILIFFLFLSWLIFSTQAKITPIMPQATTNKQDLFSELSKHNTTSDCWISYGGHIYNITSYFGSHPGGNSAMSSYCGGDATRGFDTKDQGSSHSQNAHEILKQFQIQ